MRLSALLDPLKRLAHRVFLAYAHYRWRRWRCPWRFYEGRWYVVVDDDKINDERVEVLDWYNPKTNYMESVCFPLDDHDYFDYVPMEDRISWSECHALQEEYWAQRGGRPTAKEIIEQDRREFEEYWAQREAARAAENTQETAPHELASNEARSKPRLGVWRTLQSRLRELFASEFHS